MYEIKNNLKEQILWLNKNKYNEQSGIFSGFRIINNNQSSQFESSSKTSNFNLSKEKYANNNEIKNYDTSIIDKKANGNSMFTIEDNFLDIIDIDDDVLEQINVKKRVSTDNDKNGFKVPKISENANKYTFHDLTNDSADDHMIIDEYDAIPDSFFDDEIVIYSNEKKHTQSPYVNMSVDKKNGISHPKCTEDIDLELELIQESIKQIMESEETLTNEHLETLNNLKSKRSSLLKRKSEIQNELPEELQVHLELDKNTFKSKEIEIIDCSPEKDLLPASSDELSYKNNLFNILDVEEEDLLNLDIDIVTNKNKENSKKDTSNINVYTIDDDDMEFDIPRSNFTPIPPRNGIHVEQYDPWSVLNSKWSRDDFEWSKEILLHNLQIFGHHGFRTNQKEIINAILSKKDVFVTMPTGGGKSLCYQIPALVSNAITIVIEPLISLIEDQVMILKALSVSADYIGAGQTDESSIYRDLESPNPRIKILFITPEKLMLSEKTMRIMQNLYKKNLLNLFVIDECHCVSQWGHEFRPQYKKLSVLKTHFPNVPLLALTATATPSVKTDILDVLQLRMRNNLVCFTSSFNRPNLYYEVRKKSYKTITDDIMEYINDNYPKSSGIIYCLSKQDCENVSRDLKSKGFKCEYYHADMTPEERFDVQHRWTSGKLQFICATVAFGMGINKPDVRFVIHHSLPKSLEGYYQEAGRAGRDGKPASCILFFTMKDKMRIENMLHKSYKTSMNGERMSFQVLKTNLDRLREMLSYCENDVDCRRKLLMEYFGEFQNVPKSFRCGMCDNCENTSPVETRNMIDVAKFIIQLLDDLSSLGESITKTTIIDLLKGREKLNSKYGSYNWFGSLKKTDVSSIDRVINRMVLEKALEEVYTTNAYGVVTSLHLGSKRNVQSILDGKPMEFGFRTKSTTKKSVSTPKLSRTSKKSKSKEPSYAKSEDKVTTVDDDDAHEEIRNKLINELLDLREQIHKEESAVLNNKSSSIEKLFPTSLIADIADKLPMTLEEFENVEGVGKKKAEKYAARFILVISTFIKQYSNLQPKSNNNSPYFSDQKAPSTKKKNKMLWLLKFNKYKFK